MEYKLKTNEIGARTLGYLRGDIEFVRHPKEFSHSVVFVGARMNVVKKIVKALLEDSRMTLTDISIENGCSYINSV